MLVRRRRQLGRLRSVPATRLPRPPHPYRIHRSHPESTDMTATDANLDTTGDTASPLPRWSTADVHASLDAQSFRDAMERADAGATRLVALFDEHGIRAVEPRPIDASDGAAADAVIREYNRFV